MTDIETLQQRCVALEYILSALLTEFSLSDAGLRIRLEVMLKNALGRNIPAMDAEDQAKARFAMERVEKILARDLSRL